MTNKRRRKNGTGRTRVKIAVSLPTEQVEGTEGALDVTDALPLDGDDLETFYQTNAERVFKL